jgi:transcriptional regulator with XRE-family HTH domain
LGAPPLLGGPGGLDLRSRSVDHAGSLARTTDLSTEKIFGYTEQRSAPLTLAGSGGWARHARVATAKRPKAERLTVGQKVQKWLGDRKAARPRLRPYNNAQLAAKIGVQKSTVGFWMDPRRDSTPEPENLRALAEVMQTTIEWLTDPARGMDEMDPPAEADLLARLSPHERDRLRVILADENTKRALLVSLAAIEQAYGSRSAARR